MVTNGLPDVSVCITTHNHGRYIADCLASVISQSGPFSMEIVVGDDASDDDTVSVLARFATLHPHLIRVVTHEERLGYGCLNLRALVRLATGRYIAHLDGDDFWLPGKLRSQLAFLEANPDCPAVCSNAICIDRDGDAIGLFNNRLHERSFSAGELLERGNFVNHSSLLYRAELRDDIFPADGIFIDYKLILNLSRFGDLGYLPIPLAAYRVASENSVIARSGESIRQRYWDAIQSMRSVSGLEAPVRSASADFLRRVFFRAIRGRTPAMFTEWWRVVSEAYPGARFRLAVSMMRSILVYGFVELCASVITKVPGAKIRIFYWR